MRNIRPKQVVVMRGLFGRLAKQQRRQIFVVVLLVVSLGCYLTFASHAATSVTGIEVEAGAVASPAAKVTDSSASGGQAVKFGPSSGSNCVATNVCGYSLDWDDEFSGSSIDTSKWSVRNNSGYGSGIRNDSCYFSSNITESGGHADIIGKKQTVTTCGDTNPDTGDKTFYFTSGYLIAKADTKYGYIESAIESPQGNNWWPTIWMTGGTGAPGWPTYGEFDIMENTGIYPDFTRGTYHWDCANNGTHCQTAPWVGYNFTTQQPNSSAVTANKGTQLTAANNASYHGTTTTSYVRYGFLWTTNSIVWYINGKPIRAVTVNSGNTQAQIIGYDANGTATVEKTITDTASVAGIKAGFGYNHVINVNLENGGQIPQADGYTGQDSASGFSDGNLINSDIPGTMSVDYVRVYTP